MIRVPKGQEVQIRALQVKLLMATVMLEAWLEDLDDTYGELGDEYLSQIPPEPSPSWNRRTSVGYERAEVVAKWAGLKVTISNDHSN